MSAFPPKADKQGKARLVRFVPKADSCTATDTLGMGAKCHDAFAMQGARSLNRTLRFRRDARRYVSLVHPYCAFRIAFLGGCYHQILGPRLHLPKFANGLCRYLDVWVHLDPHLIWQAAKSYVERGSVFGLESHRVLPHRPIPTADCRNSLRPPRIEDIFGQLNRTVSLVTHDEAIRSCRSAAAEEEAVSWGCAASGRSATLMAFRLSRDIFGARPRNRDREH